MGGSREIQKGIRYVITLIVVIIISCKMTSASASEDSVTRNSALKFYAGIAVAFSIHEGAHSLVAELTDTH